MFVSPLRDTVHHSMEIQSHPWGLQGTNKASGSIDEHMTQTWPIRALHLFTHRGWFRSVHMTQAWPMRTFHPLNTEIGSGDAKPNPS